MSEDQSNQRENAEILLNVVNKAASAVNAPYITFLTAGIYIGITVASTTDEMLIRLSTVTLPLLNTEIPIRGLFGFYSIAPWLMVLMHWHVLLQFTLLSDKLQRFEEEVRNIAHRHENDLCLSEQLDNFYYLWIHPRSPLTPKMRLLRRSFVLILWISLLILPMILLLWIQARFLSFHSDWTTFGHRLAVLADIILLWLFWKRIMWYPQGAPRSQTKRMMKNAPLAATFAAMLVFSWIIATIPSVDEKAEKDSWGLLGNWLPGNWVEDNLLQAIHRSWFEFRNLNLEHAILTSDHLDNSSINAIREGDTDQMLQAIQWLSPLNSFQGRDIRYVNLFNAILPRADFRALNGRRTQMQYAKLDWAQLQKSMLDDAWLKSADLRSTNLQYASMSRTVMQKADLSGAKLQAAILFDADLQDAKLTGAKLQGADLSGARLERADLRDADLRAAFLNEARLAGAKLSGANLQFADLSGTDLKKVDLVGANIRGAILNDKQRDKAEVINDSERIRYIAELACSDAYIAEGLIRQIDQMEGVEWTKHEDRKLMLRGVAKASQDPNCKQKTAKKRLQDKKQSISELCKQTNLKCMD